MCIKVLGLFSHCSAVDWTLDADASKATFKQTGNNKISILFHCIMANLPISVSDNC